MSSYVFTLQIHHQATSSYIKLHQATSTYRYRAQLYHARLTFLQQLQNAAGSRSTFRCRGNGTPTVGPFTWSARCSGMLWAIMAIMGWLNMLNIFKHIQTYSNYTTFKHFKINIGHHWTSLDMDSRPYAALCSWSLAVKNGPVGGTRIQRLDWLERNLCERDDCSRFLTILVF